jgi:hypothetical protein
MSAKKYHTSWGCTTNGTYSQWDSDLTTDFFTKVGQVTPAVSGATSWTNWAGHGSDYKVYGSPNCKGQSILVGYLSTVNTSSIGNKSISTAAYLKSCQG